MRTLRTNGLRGPPKSFMAILPESVLYRTHGASR
jgi:hypothetical protein